jgi:hypothetical protein
MDISTLKGALKSKDSLVEHPAGTAGLTGTVRRASHGAIRAERGKRGAAAWVRC